MDTTELYETCSSFAETLGDWDGDELQAEALAAMTKKLTPESRCTLVMQVMLAGANDENLSVEDKVFAARLADKLGPDWCQWFYHFAVLTTKLV